MISTVGLSPNDLLSLTAIRPLVGPTTWRPATDVMETATALVLTLDLAGVSEDDVEIALYPDVVVVSGNRRAAGGTADGVYHALQIRRGPFHVEVPVPVPVDMDQTDATLENGMLRITIGKPAGRPEQMP